MYKAVIFDFGNTIASSSSLVESLEQILESPCAKDIGRLIERKIGDLYHPDQEVQPEWLDVWDAAFSECGVPFKESIGIRHLELFAQKNQNFDFTIPLLKELKKRGYKLALLSNITGPGEIFERDLVERGLANFFDVITWSSVIGVRKPALQAFKHVLDALAVDVKEALMVGDSEIADIGGANKFGMDCVKIVETGLIENTLATYTVTRQSALDGILNITETRRELI